MRTEDVRSIDYFLQSTIGRLKQEAGMQQDIPEKLVAVITSKQGAVRSVRYSVDGNYCLTGGSDKSVKLWNPHRSLLLKSYSGHGYEVMDAQGSSDNSQICSGGMDKAVVVFDVATGNAVRKYRGHAGTVNCVCFNEESNIVLSGSIDCTVKMWDCRSRKWEPVQVMDEPEDSVTSIKVSDHEILVGSADCKIRRYDLRMGKMSSDFIGKPVSCVSFTRDGQCMLAGTMDNTVRLMDKDTGEMLNEFTGHQNDQYKIDSCLNTKDTHVLSGSEDGHVYIWDLVEATVVKKLQHENYTVVHSLSYHPSETGLLTACADKVFVWGSFYAQSQG